jgi:mycothiol synthase
MLKIHLNQLDIPKMTEQQWLDLLTVRTEFFIESWPGQHVPSDEEQRTFISQTPDLRDQVDFWLFYDDHANCLGWSTLSHPKPENPDYAANKGRIYVEPHVLERYQRHGVGTQLLPFFVDYAHKAGATWIEWDTKFESGFRFSEKIGAAEVGRLRKNSLEVDQLDWEMMQRWVDEGRSRNREVELVRFVNLPAQGMIDPICDLITDINRLQPRDDLEGISFSITPDEFVNEINRLKERNVERVIICTREPDGNLSGMTDLFYSAQKPTYADIMLTGVRREYQNRGLGKWLKAAMMFDMHEHYPNVKSISTGNFNSNRPMLSINDRMGFKLFEQYVFYKIRADDLAAKIDFGSSSPTVNDQSSE